MKNTIKPDMTVEAKARFFALYWGQEVLKASVYTHEVSAAYNLKHKSFYLSLKPLSSITGVDTFEIGRILQVYPEDVVPWLNGDSVHEDFQSAFTFQHAIDYLRSRGYALPFMGWSVEQMVEAGWIKLSEKGGEGNV
jgi:hypothetical protein